MIFDRFCFGWFYDQICSIILHLLIYINVNWRSSNVKGTVFVFSHYIPEIPEICLAIEVLLNYLKITCNNLIIDNLHFKTYFTFLFVNFRERKEIIWKKMDVLNYQDSGYNLFTYNHNNSNKTKRPHSLHSPYHLNFDGHHDFEYIVPQTTTTSTQQALAPPHYMDRYTKPLGSSSQLPMTGKSFSTDYNYRWVYFGQLVPLLCDF